MLELDFRGKDNWNKIVVTGDTHYSHKNLVSGISRWKNVERDCRQFETLAEHDQAVIEGINKTLPNDGSGILVHVGDVAFGGTHNLEKFRKAIQAKEVHIILGNHDHHLRNNKYGCRELFDSVNEKGIITLDGQLIILDHYAHRVWWKSHRGSWMLYGHSHSNLESGPYMQYKTMDVGLDNHPEFRPFKLKEIREKMKNKINYSEDHRR